MPELNVREDHAKTTTETEGALSLYTGEEWGSCEVLKGLVICDIFKLFIIRVFHLSCRR
jgi:hypothetical protein